jgi:hypothetical protein
MADGNTRDHMMQLAVQMKSSQSQFAEDLFLKSGPTISQRPCLLCGGPWLLWQRWPLTLWRCSKRMLVRDACKCCPSKAQICRSLISLITLRMPSRQRRLALIVEAGSALNEWIWATTAAGSKGVDVMGLCVERREHQDPMKKLVDVLRKLRGLLAINCWLKSAEFQTWVRHTTSRQAIVYQIPIALYNWLEYKHPY